MFKHYSTKLKYILPTYLLVLFCTLFLALAFRWLFSIHYNLLVIDETYYEMWIPFALPWIPITIWLRPKLRILKFKKQNRDSVGHQMIVWVTLGAMLVLANNYMTEATAKFEALSSVEALEDARYLSLERIKLDRSFLGYKIDVRSSGKNNEYLNFNVYCVYPFYSELDFKHWYGKKYSKRVSNNLNDYEKEKQFRIFVENSLNNFERHNYAEASYYEVLQISDDKDLFTDAINNVEINLPDNILIIEPQKGTYSADNSKTLAWVFGAFGIGTILFMITLIFPGYNRIVHQRQRNGIKPKSDDVVDMLRFLIPRGDHFITSIIVDLNILVFIIVTISGVSIFSPTAGELLDVGGNRRTEVLNGEWWRLFTSMFLHGGVLHIALNIFGLVLGSIFIEPIFGRLKYFGIYVLSGFCASLASIWWHENTVSVGASGAIFGVYGALLGLLLTNAMSKESKRSLIYLIGVYVVISLLSGLSGGIDNAAHIGGLISGAIIGITFYYLDPKAIKDRIA